MQKTAPFALFLAVALLAGCASTGYIGTKPDPEVSYDRFRDVTVIQTPRVEARGQVPGTGSSTFEMRAFTVCLGDGLCAPERIQMSLMTSSDGWLFLHARDVILLVDGQRLHYGEAERSGGIGGSRTVYEHLSWPMPAEDFRRMAFADVVEAKVGAHEFAIPPARREALRRLVTLLDSPGSPQAARP